MKTFLPLFCAAALLLAVSLPLSAAPGGDRGAALPPLSAAPYTDRDAVLRDEMEARLQLLEDKLSLQQERRLDELKNELRQLQDERKTWLDDTQNPIIATAEKKKEEVRATGDRYVGMVGSGFTSLGVLAALIALVPAIFSIANTVSFNESAKQKLNDIERIKRDVQKKREEIIKTKDETQKIGEKYIKELKYIIEKHKKTQTEWEELVKKTKISASTLDVNNIDNTIKNTKKRTIDINNAQELIRNGKGLEVLWGQAILAMSSKQWEKACSYWEDIAQQDPNDASACLNLAKCQTLWGASNNITPAQRQENFSKAENFCQEMLQQSDKLPQDLMISIYLLYASLKKIQTRYAAEKYRKELYTDAEQILQKARVLAPQDINVLALLAQIKVEQARNSPINSGELTNLRTEAEQLLLEAKELAPQDADILSRLAQLNLDMARDSQSAAERTNLRTKAEQLLLEAKELAPQHVDILGILVQFNLDTARDSQSEAERTNLRTKAEQLLLQIQKLTDPHASIFTMLAQIKLDQASDSLDPAKRTKLLTEAEDHLLHAKELDSQRKDITESLITLKLAQAKEAAPENKESFLAAAAKYLDELPPEDRAENLYERACIAALRGQLDKALELLEECHQAETLPSREDIESDKALDSLRDQDAFKEFMKRAFPTKDDTEDNA